MTRHFSGIPKNYFPFFAIEQARSENGPTLVVMARDEHLYQLKSQLDYLQIPLECSIFPGWDCLPYDRVSPSTKVLEERLNTLYGFFKMQDDETPRLCITSVAGLGQYTIPPDELKTQDITFHLKDHPKRQEILKSFDLMGFKRVDTVYEKGEFAIRGSIIDIFLPTYDVPFRLDFFGDVLESIKPFDVLTQRTDQKFEPFTSFYLRTLNEVILNPHTINRFRSAYRQLFGHIKDIIHDPLYTTIGDHRPYHGMEHWLPLFYDTKNTLLDYVKPKQILFEEGVEETFKHRLDSIFEYYTMRQNPKLHSGQPYHPLEPDQLYWDDKQWASFKQQYNIIQVHSFHQDDQQRDDHFIKIAPRFKNTTHLSIEDMIQQFSDFVKNQTTKNIFIFCQSKGSCDQLCQILEDHHFDCPIEYVEQLTLDALNHHGPYKGLVLSVFPLETGFETKHSVVFSESDILGENLRKKTSKNKKKDVFLQELSDLGLDDLVVHRDNGIGRYLGLQTLFVDHIPHDCLCIEYDGGDKLFLPVENLDLLSRYGDADSLACLDKLGGVGWLNRKARVKKRLREVADYLIQLAAERSLKKGVCFDVGGQDFQDFCNRFSFAETDDQLSAIEDVLTDLSSGKPMDRLICGDVGFGKTEVALRAAYLVASQGKQVAVITPTTLLCRQHYATFSNRFHGFPIHVRQVSRLIKPKEKTQIIQDLQNGKVDIIIATHALLSSKIQFHDLGLVIIDEEQHFGVKQKERLKELKSNVHILTLTATPIPRTLQLSLTGVRDLSLITTPPLDRLSVRTFIMQKDPMILREAILREYHRGGQIFYVTPRLEDLKELQEELRVLLPEIKFGVAHGQLSANELEEVMTGFYDKKFDLLLSTNIVESGIDVPEANTLIIHRCDLFGLAQLYQLRGRVGRSKSQSYAYLMYSPKKTLTPQAEKRLRVLQSLDTLGAGFTLASHDLDIRGAGNIVGEEQTGHIREVGVELYQTLLQEAILLTTAEKTVQQEDTKQDDDWTPTIQLGIAILIPETYVSDLSLRLHLYKRISGLKTREDIQGFAVEMTDRFGKIPVELLNLLDVVELKSLCRKAHIEKLEAGPQGLLVTFKDNVFPYPDRLITLLQKPELNKLGFIKMRPDHKVFFQRNYENPKVKRADVLQIVKAILSLLSNANEDKI